jgi:hypothetical protein
MGSTFWIVCSVWTAVAVATVVTPVAATHLLAVQNLPVDAKHLPVADAETAAVSQHVDVNHPDVTC